jgi:hypothetical protein
MIAFFQRLILGPESPGLRDLIPSFLELLLSLTRQLSRPPKQVENEEEKEKKDNNRHQDQDDDMFSMALR